MGRRVMLTVIVAILTLMLALAGGPALAATKRLPIKAGPNGLSQTSGAIGPKIVGANPSPTGSTSSRRRCSPSRSATTTSSASTAAAA